MIGATELLRLWEAGSGSGSPARDEAMLAGLGETAPVELSRRNAALLRMRARLFGRDQPLRCNCPECGAVAEFSIDCELLAQSALSPDGSPRAGELVVDGYRIQFRLPDADDVRAAAGLSPELFEGALVGRCVTRAERGGSAIDTIAELPDAVIDQLSVRMERLEPGAAISFAVTCPDCAASWTAPMGAGEILWAEIQARAERLLLDVDLLARTYGWDEPGILAMSQLRRAAYLQLAGAAQ